MDYIFMTKIDDVEVGCGECALVGGINTTKELQDAGFKMPKVMRDMLFIGEGKNDTAYQLCPVVY